jgi:hypothetical protein
LPDAAGFLEYLEEAGLLIGEAEVCSCPPALIIQSYEAMTQGAAPVAVPQIPEVTVDWDRFDEFAEAAGEMWQALIMFAIRMPDLIPQLDAAELPVHVGETLNRHLSERGAQLLDERDGLVVQVAESIRSLAGKPTPPLRAGGDLAREIQPDTVAATVMEWLRGKAPEEMARHGEIVGAAIQSQLGPYEEYEARVLRRVDTNLHLAMEALGFDAESALSAAALTRICGRTIRDWAVE